MEIFLTLLFAIELALVMTHEIGAIRCKEWRLFIGLKALPEETAYCVFTLPHIFYTVGIVFLLSEKTLINARYI